MNVRQCDVLWSDGNMNVCGNVRRWKGLKGNIKSHVTQIKQRRRDEKALSWANVIVSDEIKRTRGLTMSHHCCWYVWQDATLAQSCLHQPVSPSLSTSLSPSQVLICATRTTSWHCRTPSHRPCDRVKMGSDGLFLQQSQVVMDVDPTWCL